MNDRSLENLLKPSLSESYTTGKVYSLQAHFLVAFIGGPLALVLFAMWSMKGIGRLRHHSSLFAGLAAIAVACTAIFTYLGVEGFTIFGDAASTARILLRFSGLCLFGILYAALNRYFNVSNFGDSPVPSPWIPGICAIVAGVALQFVITFVLVVAFDLEAI